MSDKELNSVIDRAEDEYQKLKDKVIEDTLLDLANYCLLARASIELDKECDKE